MQSATQAGLWVILAARAKYAAGYTWPDQPDVWHDPDLRATMVEMWRSWLQGTGIWTAWRGTRS